VNVSMFSNADRRVPRSTPPTAGQIQADDEFRYRMHTLADEVGEQVGQTVVVRPRTTVTQAASDNTAQALKIRSRRRRSPLMST